MLRWLTAGESHGQSLTGVIDGLPAGVTCTTADITEALARRRLGFGRGARMKFEQDVVTITGGIRHGKTMGGPIAVSIANSEWPKWDVVMSADPVAEEELENIARSAPLTRPRPGHADLAGMQKFGLDDIRPILERASARETAARVALGEIAKKFLEQAAGIHVLSHVVSIGPIETDTDQLPEISDLASIDEDPVRCFSASASEKMQEEIRNAHSDGDTIGGVVEVLAYNLPVGLGSHTHWDRRLDSKLAAALMGIQAIKGVEVGDGFETARRRGTQAHDEIFNDNGELKRRTGRAGGTEGGMSTGDVLRVRAAMKPISTVPKALETVDVATGESAVAINQRSDACAVPAAGVVAEAMVALVLAEALLDKFGGDNVSETSRNVNAYRESIGRSL